MLRLLTIAHKRDCVCVALSNCDWKVFMRIFTTVNDTRIHLGRIGAEEIQVGSLNQLNQGDYFRREERPMVNILPIY